jgi:uncharacterized protein YndB with AHSA1/START domain
VIVMASDFAETSVIHIHREMQIAASPADVFESVIMEMGEENRTPNGTSMNLKLERWPGGRWYRDLGNNAGHLWGHVQVIKPPTLIEICGPMFMSYPVMSHVQYRLKEASGGTLLTLTHRAIGDLVPEHKKGVAMGWDHQLSRIKDRCTK